jgi:hypothetical protein
MPEDRDVKKMYKWKLIVSIPVGLPMIRWMDNVMKDIQAMMIVKCRSTSASTRGVHIIEINGSQLLSTPNLTWSV